MTEKRKSRRISKRLDVEYSKEAQKQRGFSKNVSENGAFISSKDSHAPGSVITLTIHLPNDTTSVLQGIVRHVETTPPGEEGGMGIEFIETDDNFVNFINLMAGEFPEQQTLICPTCGTELVVAGRQGQEPSLPRCKSCGAFL